MQRLITLDGVIYVHENPKRRRRPVYVEPDPDAFEPEPVAYDPEPAAYDPEPELEPEPEPEAVGAYAEPSEEWSPAPVQVPEEAVEVVAQPPAGWPAAVAEVEPVAKPAANTRTIVRSTPVAPPPGYAVEFGTGRLVKIHSYKGRMSYPSSGW